jgi:glycosyltransferase involved in cell wall biosynthesis
MSSAAAAAAAATAAAASPLVSICIPTYNAEATLRETLASAMAQTMPDFEVVISDDGSTDGTLREVGGFGSDARIRVLPPGPRLGLEGNWNRAAQSARGRYVKLLGHDDVLYPDCLNEQLAVLEDPANAGVVLVGCRRDIVGADGRMMLRNRGRLPAGRIGGRDAIRRVVRSGTNPIGEPVAVLFRADAFAGAFAGAGGFDGRRPYMIDVDMWCRLLDAGDLYFIRKTLCAFRTSSGTLSGRLAREQAEQAKAFFHELRERHPDSVSALDVRIGKVKAAVLARARRTAYAWCGSSYIR